MFYVSTLRDIAREDSCTIFLGRRRICFELVPPVRPEMIAVRRLLGDEVRHHAAPSHENRTILQKKKMKTSEKHSEHKWTKHRQSLKQKNRKMKKEQKEQTEQKEIWTDMNRIWRSSEEGMCFFPNAVTMSWYVMIIHRWFVFVCFLSNSVRSSHFVNVSWSTPRLACQLCLKQMSRGASCIELFANCWAPNIWANSMPWTLCKDGEEEQLPLELAKQVINLVHDAWKQLTSVSFLWSPTVDYESFFPVLLYSGTSEFCFDRLRKALQSGCRICPSQQETTWSLPTFSTWHHATLR